MDKYVNIINIISYKYLDNIDEFSNVRKSIDFAVVF